MPEGKASRSEDIVASLSRASDVFEMTEDRCIVTAWRADRHPELGPLRPRNALSRFTTGETASDSIGGTPERDPNSVANLSVSYFSFNNLAREWDSKT